MGHLYHSYVSLPKGNWQPSEVGLHIWSSGRNPKCRPFLVLVENGITIWIMIPNILLHIIPYIINQPSFISTKISPIPWWWTSLNSLTIINHQPGIRPTSLPWPVPALEVGPSCGRPRPGRGVGSPRWPRRGSVDLGVSQSDWENPPETMVFCPGNIGFKGKWSPETDCMLVFCLAVFLLIFS